MTFDPETVRGQFPALMQKIGGVTPVFFDGPGGTQVPKSVTDAMTDYLARGNSNLSDNPFSRVQATHEVVDAARRNAAAFVNGSAQEIVFGPNMTTITAHLSRSIAQEWKAGDEIIVSELDHYSNVSFWVQEAQNRGVKVHHVPVRVEDCTLDMDYLESALSEKTRLVSFTLAANICGSRTDAARIIGAAKRAGALTYVDSVHAAVHFLPDVKDLDCDFLACSAYKFFGPHLGFVFAKAEHLARLTPFKVAPASDVPPERWETGTKSFEALAGFNGTISYLNNINKISDLRVSLKKLYQDISAYEQAWSRRFLERASALKTMKIYGITDAAKTAARAATFAFTLGDKSPQDVVAHLASKQIAAGAGNFYARGVTDALGLTDKGGVVRVGCVHYNTFAEMDRLFEALEGI